MSCPIYSVLPEKIKKIFGERNRNICGQYVKFEPVGGNTIHFSYGLVLKIVKFKLLICNKESQHYNECGFIQENMADCNWLK